MLDKETKAWLNSVFSRDQISTEEVEKHCAEILSSTEGNPSSALFYELAIVHADAAMTLLEHSKGDLIFRGAVAAGFLKKSFDLAVSYANERSQGGKLIKDWTLVQQMLAEIYLQVKINEKLIHSRLSEAEALGILKNSDQMVSLCLQVMGGAGYTEDYIVEKFFRHIHFLKNHPVPFAKNLVHFYAKADHS